MTRLTKMRISPAKPDGNGAAVAALPFVKLGVFLGALAFDLGHISAIKTNHFRRISILYQVLFTITTASKVRLFALEADIIRKAVHCIQLGILIVRRAGRDELFVFEHAVNFEASNGVGPNLVKEFQMRLHNGSQQRMLHLHFAKRTVKIAKGNAVARPLAVNAADGTGVVKDVAASQQNTRSSLQIFHPAD